MLRVKITFLHVHENCVNFKITVTLYSTGNGKDDSKDEDAAKGAESTENKSPKKPSLLEQTTSHKSTSNQ